MIKQYDTYRIIGKEQNDNNENKIMKIQNTMD